MVITTGFFDNAGGLISEERTVRLDFDCGQERKLARINFVDDFAHDSVHLIVGNFTADFSVDKTASSEGSRKL